MRNGWWKIYFWLISFVLIVGYAGMFSASVNNFYAMLVDILIIALWWIGIYSYVFSKKIFSSIFWKYFFWISVIYLVIDIIFVAFPNQPYFASLASFKTERSSWSDSIFSWALFIPLFYALFELPKAKLHKLKIGKVTAHKKLMKSIRTLFTSTSKRFLGMTMFLKKLSKIKKVALGISMVILLLLGSGIGYSQYLLWQAREQMPNVEETIDEYLTYASAKEYREAYNLFSNEYKKYEDLNTFQKKNDYIRPVLDNYLGRSLTMDDFIVNFYLGQPIHLSYKGYILYEDRERGFLEAIFLLKNNKWELYGIKLNTSQRRFDKYTPPQEKPEL